MVDLITNRAQSDDARRFIIVWAVPSPEDGLEFEAVPASPWPFTIESVKHKLAAGTLDVTVDVDGTVVSLEGELTVDVANTDESIPAEVGSLVTWLPDASDAGNYECDTDQKLTLTLSNVSSDAAAGGNYVFQMNCIRAQENV